MRKGDVPIPYIVAIIIAIAVVALLGYWFYVTGGKFWGSLTEEECRQSLTTYCQGWSNEGYAGAAAWTDAMKCLAYKSTLDATAPKCKVLLGQPPV